MGRVCVCVYKDKYMHRVSENLRYFFGGSYNWGSSILGL